MPMPKAAMHEDRLFSAREHQIGLSGQSTDVEPVSKPQTVDETPDKQLRLGVLPPDPGHSFASFLRR